MSLFLEKRERERGSKGSKLLQENIEDESRKEMNP